MAVNMQIVKDNTISKMTSSAIIVLYKFITAVMSAHFDKSEYKFESPQVKFAFPDWEPLAHYISDLDKLEWHESIILLTALMPQLQPNFFETIIAEQLPNGGDFREFGGVRVYDINLADQFVKAFTNNPDTEFGSTHPLINSVDLTVSSANPINEPVDSDLSTTKVGNEFEASVTNLPVNETSFHMRLPQKGLTRWALNVPIGNVSGLFQNQICRISNTNIDVTGSPSNTAIITQTHVHEGVHAQHIHTCHNNGICMGI